MSSFLPRLSFLFWVHHANADRFWAKWQASDPKHFDAIGGDQLLADGTYEQLTLDSKLDYYGIPVKQLLSTTAEPYCYTYDDIIAPKERVAKLAIQKLKLLPKAQLKKYFPKILDGTATAFNIDFLDVESLETCLSKPLPVPSPMPPGFYESMNFNATRGHITEKLCQDFVNDMNLVMFHKRGSDPSRSTSTNDTRHLGP